VCGWIPTIYTTQRPPDYEMAPFYKLVNLG
jgi:hypothetical protein